MRRGWNWLLLAWPGLPHLWMRGSWAGLALAVGFTVHVSILIVSWLVWTAWLPRSVQFAGAGFALIVWGGSMLVALRSRIVPDSGPAAVDGNSKEGRGEDAVDSEPLFRRAQSQYLQGDWMAAERTLDRLLNQNARDVEARLLLATLCRHRHRLAEASEHLARLERLEASERWAFEIRTERERLARRPTAQTASAPTPDLAGKAQRSAEKVSETVSFSHNVAKNRPERPPGAPERGLPTRPDADTIGRIDAA